MQQLEENFKRQLHDNNMLIKELLTYKHKMNEPTSKDDSNTSKGNYKLTQTNEVEKGIRVYQERMMRS